MQITDRTQKSSSYSQTAVGRHHTLLRERGRERGRGRGGERERGEERGREGERGEKRGRGREGALAVSNK